MVQVNRSASDRIFILFLWGGEGGVCLFLSFFACLVLVLVWTIVVLCVCVCVLFFWGGGLLLLLLLSVCMLHSVLFCFVFACRLKGPEHGADSAK